MGMTGSCAHLQMDRLGANYMKTVGEIRTMLGSTPLVVNLPIGSEETFQGVFDLVAMKSIIWTGEVSPAFLLVSDFCPHAITSITGIRQSTSQQADTGGRCGILEPSHAQCEAESQEAYVPPKHSEY